MRSSWPGRPWALFGNHLEASPSRIFAAQYLASILCELLDHLLSNLSFKFQFLFVCCFAFSLVLNMSRVNYSMLLICLMAALLTLFPWEVSGAEEDKIRKESTALPLNPELILSCVLPRTMHSCWWSDVQGNGTKNRLLDDRIKFIHGGPWNTSDCSIEITNFNSSRHEGLWICSYRESIESGERVNGVFRVMDQGVLGDLSTEDLSRYNNILRITAKNDTTHLTEECRKDQAVCQTGQCIVQGLFCDGNPDCSDFSDEFNCSKTKLEDFKNVVYTTEASIKTFDTNFYWDGGEIPYLISNLFNETEKRHIDTAIGMIVNSSCVRFVNYTAGDFLHYINITKPKSNSVCKASNTGNAGGEQHVLLGTSCFGNEFGTALQLLMRIVGFGYEQQRPDRDDYIFVFWENITDSGWRHFEKRTWGNVQDACSDYDYESIMHLSPQEFSKGNHLSTFQVIEVGQSNPPGLGQRMKLSELDVQKLNKMYGCTVEKDDLATIQTYENQMKSFVHELIFECETYNSDLRDVCLSLLSEVKSC